MQTQGMTHYATDKWKNDDQLWWTGAKPGDKLEMAVPVEEDGTLRRERRPDQGPRLRHRAALRSTARRPASRSTSTTPTVDPHRADPSAPTSLTEGDHTLGVEIVGANEKAVKSYMFGLDYVIFEKKP